MFVRASLPAALLILGLASATTADGPQDNQPDAVRRIPMLGIEVPPETRAELEQGLADLRRAIDKASAPADDSNVNVPEKGRAAAKAARQARDARIARFLPDVLIYEKAVRDALVYREFFAPQELNKARELLKEGLERANHLDDAQPPWTTQTGLVVRGYISKIDGSVQPYGLVIPESYTAKGPGRFRLDVWFHGRGETLSELNFVDQQRRQPGQFTPVDTIVLHPYGRYSNAFKFAGEVDVLEGIEAVQRHYRIDDDRIAVRGFSMGGAGCWQFAVHYSDRWFSANPGAGFAETARFLKIFQKETLQPSSYEQRLWHLYDCTDVAANLLQCPTVAYSGEIDTQKQAADVMAEALKAERIELTHIIGPATKHAYHPDSKREVERRMESLAARGRQRYPSSINFTTYTLKYNRMSWVTIDALGEHWNRARVRADRKPEGPVVTTENVAALTLEYAPGWSPYTANAPVQVTIDGTKLTVAGSLTDRSWKASFRRNNSRWEEGTIPGDRIVKRHDLQGPIDDAFMDSFVFVRPTGTSTNPVFEAWVAKEMPRAIEHWRRHFRGEARVKDDTSISDQDIASTNLVLWGDPGSNAILRRIADGLPIAWDNARIKVGADNYASDQHALILIAPNPLNPARYVVLNSGFTFREYDYLNNARQVPKLPDWAVIDLRTPPNSRYPGKIVAADFLGEDWKLK